jgi:hypothetical protein
MRGPDELRLSIDLFCRVLLDAREKSSLFVHDSTFRL